MDKERKVIIIGEPEQSDEIGVSVGVERTADEIRMLIDEYDKDGERPILVVGHCGVGLSSLHMESLIRLEASNIPLIVVSPSEAKNMGLTVLENYPPPMRNELLELKPIPDLYFEEPLKDNPEGLFGTRQKKFRRGTTTKYFKRKTKHKKQPRFKKK